MMRTLKTLIAVAGLCTLGMAGVARAEWDVVAEDATAKDGAIAPVIDAFGGIVVWNEREGDDAVPRYHLAALVDGRRVRLPIAPRLDAPFDVDLGPDGRGGVAAAYSRCRTEADVVGPVFSDPYPAWTAARGCDLFRFDFAAMTESKIAGASTDQASEMLPSVWKGHIAFVRVYEQRKGSRGVYPYLYVRRIGAQTTSRRQPGGSRGVSGLPGPTRLDLYGRRLAFVWNYEQRSGEDSSGVSTVRLDTVGGGRRILSRARFSGDEMASFLGPQGADGRIAYGYQRVRARHQAVAIPEPDGGHIDAVRTTITPVASLLLRYRLSTGDKELSRDAPDIMIDAATDGRRTYVGNDHSSFVASGPGRVLSSSGPWHGR